MRAKCINFNGKTLPTLYRLYIDKPNKVSLRYDNNPTSETIYLYINDDYAGYMNEIDLYLNVSDYVNDLINNDMLDFYVNDVEYKQHFKNVTINYLKQIKNGEPIYKQVKNNKVIEHAYMV